MKYQRIPLFILTLFAIPVLVQAVSLSHPKREFRGAWLQTVYQDRFLKNSTEDNKEFLSSQLDILQLSGINAVLFQVRPSADAFYESQYEPWSRFISPTGEAPDPYWDPLQFMIEECHRRGMELHAWINPYRVTTSAKDVLPKGHIYHRDPSRFITFDRKLYFDPGLPENRKFIVDIINDIVSRYEVDGIHFDDYFYPYPVKGIKFNDEKSYAKYGEGMDLAQWRRRNVDLLIEEVSSGIRSIKPWVRFGISPFGIWRNKTSDPRGSDTRGLQNYDDLYADVLLWAEKGWIDYLIPQLYWSLENKIASSEILASWWADNCHNRHIYIGQNIKVTLPDAGEPQLERKIDITRKNPAIQGNCWWSGFDITVNHRGVMDSLSVIHHPEIALPPEYPWLSQSVPERPRNVRLQDNVIKWEVKAPEGKPSDATRFVIYAFSPSDEIDIRNPESIVCVTPDNSFNISSFPKGTRFAVTSLSRVNNESLPSSVQTFR